MTKHGLKKKLENRKRPQWRQLIGDDEKNPRETLNVNSLISEQAQAAELSNPSLHAAQRFTLASQLARLQGNQHLQRLVMPPLQQPEAASHQEDRSTESSPFTTRTVVERFAVKATIQRKSDSEVIAPPPAVLSRRDAEPGAEHGDDDYKALFEKLSSTRSGATSVGASTPDDEANAPMSTEVAPGVPITIPDIEIPALSQIGRTDAVNGKFKYRGSIARSYDTPSAGNFGETLSFDSKLTGITITPKAKTFEVSATFEHPITYRIRSGTGPSGQVDIASETDGDITKASYPTVVSDLTPNTADLNGRPPRTKFWAEDLTVLHELVHAKDDKSNGPGAMATVTAWLNGQTAANVAGVTTLLGTLPGRFATALLAALSTEAGEKHAYGDGAAAYKARANAIKRKGDKGDYK